MTGKNNNFGKTLLCKSCGKKYTPPLTSRPSNFCPICCALLPDTKKFIEEYFSRIDLNKKLDEAKRLFLKNEYVATARVATILLEEEIRKLIKDDSLSGIDLMAKVFSFEYDEKNKKMIREPLIKLNSLETKTQRDEQEGMKFFCMGIMGGVRNILAHSTPFIIPFRCLILISDIEFILQEITRGSSIIHDY